MAASKIRLKIASPCNVSWDEMTGDDAVRFCGKCEKNVYQLSAMTSEQVEALLAAPGETPCVRFYQRRDGTVLTADCPVGVRGVRRKQAVAGVGLSLLSALGYAAWPSAPGPTHTAPPAEPTAQPTYFVELPAMPPAPPIDNSDDMIVMGAPAAEEPPAEPEPPPPAKPDHRPKMGKPALMGKISR